MPRLGKNGFTRPITGAGMKPVPNCPFIARDSSGIFAIRYVGRSAGDGACDPNTIARLTVRRCAAVNCARVLQTIALADIDGDRRADS